MNIIIKNVPYYYLVLVICQIAILYFWCKKKKCLVVSQYESARNSPLPLNVLYNSVLVTLSW